MRSTTRLLMILFCVAPLALTACQSHEHPGNEAAAGASSSDEHPGDSGSGHDDSGAANDSEHPGDE